MKNFDIIILGAGASGCMCAITAASSGKNILLIDKLSKAGKKLLATGNGRCNLTNFRQKESEKYYNQNIDKFLSRIGYPTSAMIVDNKFNKDIFIKNRGDFYEKHT